MNTSIRTNPNGTLDWYHWELELNALVITECVENKDVYIEKIQEYLQAMAKEEFWCGNTVNRVNLCTSKKRSFNLKKE